MTTVKTDCPYDDNIVGNYVSCGGSNSPEEITNYLRGRTSEQLAKEILESWNFPKRITLTEMTREVQAWKSAR